MKKMTFTKIAAATMAAVMVAGSLVACGNAGGGDTSGTNNNASADSGSSVADTNTSSDNKGTIMWLSNLSSGPQYEGAVNYATELCKSLGYNFSVVYGDSFNDPAGNLTQVKNAMTSDVVGLIASQDGGIQNILEEYPNLYVCGYNSDMASVYDENGSSAAALNNEHFLGSIVDGYISGEATGHDFAQEVITNGYKKVSTIIFPSYAYPQLAVADATFRSEIEEYNATADEPIEIVGDAKVLEFAPLEDSYFMDAQYQDLDAIVAICADTFVYPAMKSAQASGTCSADTKLLSSGWEDDADLLADFGNTITYVSISPIENIAYSVIMLDNAINGLSYSDGVTPPERLDSARMNIRTQDDVKLLTEQNLLGTGNAADAWISVDEAKNMCLSVNSGATYADLKALFASEQLTLEGHK